MSSDASGDAADGGLLPFTPPDIPWEGATPVELGPCPDGWRLATERTPAECDPYPEAGHAVCEDGEAHFPGEPGCRSVGTACPAGDFAESLPSSGPVVYVRSGSTSGDGSLASPYGALSEVRWTSLAAGTTVAIGKGTYEGVLAIEAGTRVIGACPAETILTGVDAPVPAVVRVSNAGEGALVSNLTIRDPPQAGVRVPGGRSLRLEGVVIDGAAEVGILSEAAGAVITLEEVIIDRTRIAPSLGGLGHGVVADLGGRVEGHHVAVRRSGDSNFAAVAGGIVVLTDSVSSRAVGRPDGTQGRGVNVQESHFEGTRVAVEDNQDVGIFAALAGTTVRLEDVFIRGTRESARESGRGLVAQDGVHLEATRVVVAQNVEVGIFVSDPDTMAMLSHVVVRGTDARASGSYGRGIQLVLGARLDASNVAILENHDLGVAAEASEVVLADALIARTAAEVDSGDFGRGIEIHMGSVARASRLVMEENHHAAVLVASGSSLTLDDAILRATQPRPLDEGGGAGIVVQENSRLTASRLQISDVLENAIFAVEATVDVRDLSIREVARSRCADAACAMRPFGYGLTVLDSNANVSRFEVDTVEVCGIFLASVGFRPEGPMLDLSDGVVSHARIGACVQVEGYDLERLMNGVEYRDNVTNLDSTALPVPEPVRPGEPIL